MITHYMDLEQGSDEWLEARRGILTASEMGLILTPTLKVANNEKTRIHLYELLAQRISKFVEPKYIGSDMLRGEEDEPLARDLYSERFSPVTECGFVTNDRHGVKIGYSPDGLVGELGLIEIKSRLQKYQVQTIIENVVNDIAPNDYMLQLQTGLLVSEREWIDFISYHGGLPMAVIRVYPDDAIKSAIIEASQAFEHSLQEKLKIYNDATASDKFRLVPTERIEEEDISFD